MGTDRLTEAPTLVYFVCCYKKAPFFSRYKPTDLRVTVLPVDKTSHVRRLESYPYRCGNFESREAGFVRT